MTISDAHNLKEQSSDTYPLVSVVMAAFNAEPFIREAIESVIRQTYTRWELIVVDDASEDRTADIAARYVQIDPRVILVRSEVNSGPACARNKAVARANGRYIAFLDADDVWLPQKLDRQVRAMEEQHAALSFTAYRKIDSDGNIGKTTISVPNKVSYKELLKSNVIGCLTAMYDTQAIGKVYMPEDFRREDYRLWLQILKFNRLHEDYALWLAIVGKQRTANAAIGINEVLAHYRVHANSVSRNKLKAARMQWAVYRRIEKLSIWRSLYYFAQYAYHGYRKSRLR